MPPLFLAVLIGIAVYAVIVALIPRRILADSTQYTRHMLQKLAQDRPLEEVEENFSVLRAQSEQQSLMATIFYTFPGANAARPKLMRAGLANSIEMFFGMCLAVFFASLYVGKGAGWIVFPSAVAMAY
ncbi:MAG: hypothetical protein K2Q01_06715, partial [Rickettsiales bacterium]|nr:hypothetical protein [Rickettsiales bacterium]